jgi:hypothetical protein
MTQADLARAAFSTYGNSASPGRARPAEPPSRLARRRLEGQAPAPRLHHRCRHALVVRHGLQEAFRRSALTRGARGRQKGGEVELQGDLYGCITIQKLTHRRTPQAGTPGGLGRVRRRPGPCCCHANAHQRWRCWPEWQDGRIGQARGSKGTTGRHDLPPVSQPSGSAVDRPRHATVCRPTMGPGGHSPVFPTPPKHQPRPLRNLLAGT